MSAEANALVQQAQQALKAGNKSKAKDLLLKAVDIDEKNEMAWLFMSGVVDTPEEQLICLENVLAINPNNAKAKLGMEKVSQKTNSQRSAPAPKPADPFGGVADPFGSANPFGSWDQPAAPAAPTPPAANPFETAADPFAAMTDPFGAGSNPFSTPPPPAAPPTSVEWGNKNAPPAPSARAAQQVTPDQYDDWISNMGIGKQDTPPAASTPAFGAAPSADPWADVTNDPWGSLPPAKPPAAPKPVDPFLGGNEPDPWGGSPSDPWGSTAADAFSSGRGTKAAAPDPFGAAPSTPAFSGGFDEEAPAAAGSSRNAAAGASSRSAANAFESSFGGSDSFSFDEDGSFFEFGADDDDDAFAFGGGVPVTTTQESDPFAELEEAAASPKKGKAKTKPAAEASPYFQYLPDEFKSAGGSSRPLMMAAAGLGVLNVLALVGVILAVM